MKPKILPRDAHVQHVSGDHSERHFGSTRPGAVADEAQLSVHLSAFLSSLLHGLTEAIPGAFGG